MSAFENAIEAGLRASVDFALFAGDSFHRPAADPMLGEVFLSGLERLAHAGIPSFVITGNHDPCSALLGEGLLPAGVTVFRSPQTEVLREFGVAIHGLSIADERSSENALIRFPPPIEGLFNIGMLHTSLQRIDVRTYAPVEPQALLEYGYDYWALGHIHERMTYSAGNRTLHYPANPQALTSKDTGPRGITIASVSDAGAITLQLVATAVLRFDMLDWDPSDTTSLTKQISAILLRNRGVATVVVPRRHEPSNQIAALAAAVDAYATETDSLVALASTYEEKWTNPT